MVSTTSDNRWEEPTSSMDATAWADAWTAPRIPSEIILEHVEVQIEVGAHSSHRATRRTGTGANRSEWLIQPWDHDDRGAVGPRRAGYALANATSGA